MLLVEPALWGGLGGNLVFWSRGKQPSYFGAWTLPLS